MKSFKTFLNENRLATSAAALGLASAAMAAPPKPEAMEMIVDYLKTKEGFRPVAERDKDASGNPVVVGYGTTHVYADTKKPIQLGDKISKEEADRQLRTYLSNMTPSMEKIPGWDEMDPGKQAALLSFGYNFGPDFYRPNVKSDEKFYSISQDLKTRNWENVPKSLSLYNKGVVDGQKVVLPGLVTRREEEGKMWSGSTETKKTSTKEEAPKVAPKVAPKEEPKPASTGHTVSKGETLSGIAKKYGTTVDDLIRKNPSIKNPNLIKPGQKIITK